MLYHTIIATTGCCCRNAENNCKPVTHLQQVWRIVIVIMGNCSCIVGQGCRRILLWMEGLKLVSTAKTASRQSDFVLRTRPIDLVIVCNVFSVLAAFQTVFSNFQLEFRNATWACKYLKPAVNNRWNVQKSIKTTYLLGALRFIERLPGATRSHSDGQSSMRWYATQILLTLCDKSY